MSVGAHGPRRPYRAGRRAKAAAETRAAILDAALRLFVENGYGSVTVGDIARESDTAVPTVYASTGGKSSILASLISEGIADPIVDETLAAVGMSSDPREAVAVATHGVRIDNERHFDLVRVLVTAAALDETAKETLTRANRSYREALGVVARRLEDLDALGQGMFVDRAADILWFFLGHHSWRVYVTDSGWSWNDTEKWLAEQVSAALLSDRGD
ncbi:TetR/AcrR family transcriptional regulator [Streptomyces mirabilis]|uniref:TetR/AcrR family transcriptional regulator n=1 Tax=Streptomyces mirabilis TaxID=68239 RepID=UPI0036C0AD05